MKRSEERREPDQTGTVFAAAAFGAFVVAMVLGAAGMRHMSLGVYLVEIALFLESIRRSWQ